MFVVAFTRNVFADKVDKAQAVVFFVVVIVMRNELGHERKSMSPLTRESNHQDQKQHDALFQSTHIRKNKHISLSGKFNNELLTRKVNAVISQFFLSLLFFRGFVDKFRLKLPGIPGLRSAIFHPKECFRHNWK